MNNLMISCDWGTSQFRLSLVDTQSQVVLKKCSTTDGILNVYSHWSANEKENCSLKTYYLRELRKQVDELIKDHSDDLKNIPIIISGMASSSMGIIELPYATLPFTLDGKDAIVELIEPTAEFPFETILISGVKGEDDLMRGEETQMVGIAELVNSINSSNETICIFPGTHSKHIKINNGSITGFNTYMTGEIFQLLSNQSVLKEAVSISNNGIEEHKEQFHKGIDDANENTNLLNELFGVRTNVLMKKISKENNYYYLSGLLIGYELSVLKHTTAEQIILCSGNSMFELYKLAIERVGIGASIEFISPDLMEKSAIAGQIKIYQSHYQLK
jgi:2-dehydro-3-deoxygalactonokinase